MRFRLALALVAWGILTGLGGAVPVPQQKPATPPPQLPLAPVWDVTLDAPPSAWSAADGEHLFLALDASERPARIVALSLADGTVAWQRDLANVRFLASGDHLLFVATDADVQAFSAADGQPLWQAALAAPPTVPLVAANGWLLAAAEKQLTAFGAGAGAIIWQRTLSGKPAGAPAVAGDGVFLPSADNRVLKLDLQTGNQIWDAPIAAMPASVLALDDRVFVGTKGRFFYALDPKDGGVRWRVRTGSDVVGSPLVDAARVYFLSLDNLLRGVKRSSGDIEARRVLTRRALFGPYAAGKVLIVSGMSQTIEAFTPQHLQTAGIFDVGGREGAGVRFAGPLHVVPNADGTLIVGVTGEGEVIALRWPGEKKATAGTGGGS